MRIISIGSQKRLLTTGDWHEGNGASHEEGINKFLERAAKFPWIHEGDLVEAIMPGDKRFSIHEHFKPITESRATVVDYVNKAKKTCIGLISGNHEESASKAPGSFTKDLCRELDVKFLTCDCFVHMGALTAFFSHRAPVTARRSGPIERINANSQIAMQEAFRFVEADVCGMAHIHRCIVSVPTFEHRLSSDGARTRMSEKLINPKWCFSVPAMFKVYDEDSSVSNYAEQALMRPTTLGWCEIVMGRAGVEAIEQYNEKGKLLHSFTPQHA